MRDIPDYDKRLEYTGIWFAFSMLQKGDNAIHLAAQHGYLDIIRELKGVDLELPNLVGGEPRLFLNSFISLNTQLNIWQTL